MSIYVCSDLHGFYDKWQALLKKILFKSTDTMYILGDVIDRGPEPVKLLKDILSRENCVLIMGNHEKMMLDYYTAQNNNYSYFNVYDCYHIWVQNGGYVTLNQMDNLPEDDRLSILEAIKKLPLAKIGLEVNRVLKNGTSKPYTYYLVHASYGQAFYPVPSIITLSSVADSECKKMLWERKSYYKGQHKLTYTQKNLYQNVTLISGHTSTNNLKNKVPSSGKFRIDNMGKDGSGRILHSHKGHAINVDCGIYCKTPILGCLRLDDWAEFYIK